MSKFTANFEDETLEGLQRQIVDFLCNFNGFGFVPAAGVSADDNGGEDPVAGEPAEGDDQPE